MHYLFIKNFLNEITLFINMPLPVPLVKWKMFFNNDINCELLDNWIDINLTESNTMVGKLKGK